MSLDTATLNGITLEMEHLDDAFEKSIVRHEIPYRDGALLEDTGQKARTIRMRCYFWDDGAGHATYDAHLTLIAGLESRELQELLHPRYGLIKVCVEQLHVRHDDRLRTAEVDLTFIENMRTPLEPVYTPDVEAVLEEAFAASTREQLDEFSADMTAALGPEAAGIMAVELNPELGIVEQLQGVSLTARAWLTTVEVYVSTMEAQLTTVVNPANGLVAAISYGVNLPGRVIGATARCVERYAELYNSAVNAPVRFLDSLTLGLLDLELACGQFGKTVRLAGSAQVACSAGRVYRADETARTGQLQREGTPAFDLLGSYRYPEATAAAMTVTELETTLAAVRGYLQGAVDLSRSAGAVKTMALQLLIHVNTVKLQRENIVQIRLDNVTPLHLVCLAQGLPYQAAERLLAINNIRNPNYTSGTVNVYVR